VIGVLGPHHAHAELLGVSAAYRDRDRHGLASWTRLVGATVELRLHAALLAVRWGEEAETIDDSDVREVLEGRLAILDSADGIESLLGTPPRRRGRRQARHRISGRRDVRVFEQLLASAEESRPCTIPERVEIASVRTLAKGSAPKLAPTDLPTVAPRTALEAVRRR